MAALGSAEIRNTPESRQQDRNQIRAFLEGLQSTDRRSPVSPDRSISTAIGTAWNPSASAGFQTALHFSADQFSESSISV